MDILAKPALARRALLRGAVTGVGGVLAATMAPAPARSQADPFGPLGPFGLINCRSGRQVAAFGAGTAQAKSAGFADWHLGDCELSGATLSLQSNGTGRFSAQVCTHFTHSKDYWHLYVELAEASGGSVFLTKYLWQGPRMSEQDHPLFHAWSESFRFDPAAFARIRYARSTSCC